MIKLNMENPENVLLARINLMHAGVQECDCASDPDDGIGLSCQCISILGAGFSVRGFFVETEKAVYVLKCGLADTRHKVGKVVC